MTDEQADDACRMAFEAALEQAVGGYCESERARAEVTKPLFGLERGEGPDPDDVLAEGIGPGATLEETQRWVHARTNQLIEQEEMDFDTASSQAWDEAENEQDPFADDLSFDTMGLDDGGDGVDLDDVEVHDSPFGEG